MKILIAYDGSGSADAAIEDLRRAGLPQVADALVVSAAEDGLAAEANAEALAGRAAEQIQSLFPCWNVSSEALWGSPAKLILDNCERCHPDLLIVGSHGRSRVERLFLGSVSLELV